MTSIVPIIDDTEFASLVEDGRGLIPRYAPDWTDHNLHDPGITLIDLIAWLVDQQIYRTGFVGESLRGAFTRLMGIAPRGPKSSEVLVWPGPNTLPILDLEAGTKVTTPDIVEAEFTLTHHIRTVQPKVDEIVLVTADEVKPLGNGLTEGRDPLTLLPHAGGGPRALVISLSAPIAQVADAGAISLGFSLTAQSGGAAGAWDAITLEQHDPAGHWHPLEVKDETGGLARSGVILFEPSLLSPARVFRLRLDRGFRPAPVKITRLGLNVLPLREGVDVLEQKIGDGTGLPDQQIDFFSDDIVDRASTLKVLTGAGAWGLVADLETSGPQDRHVRLSPEGLVFGNGLNGQVVLPGAQVRVAPLRRTKGHAGAVAKGLNWVVAGLPYGSNIAPSTPGRDRETLSDLARRARQVVKRREAVLSAQALEARLLVSPLGLARVQVTPRRRPGLDGAEAPGSRTVLIVPARDPNLPPHPATQTLREKVEGFLAPMRLLGERFYVSPPLYVGVDVTVDLVVEADADLQTVRSVAEGAIRARLWDLRRTQDQIIVPWQAGRDVSAGEIEGMMSRISQVLQVPDCQIAPAGLTPSRDPIPLSDREIALAQSVTVTVRRAREGGQR